VSLLPLFPLDLVLFPGTVSAVAHFEPRYQEMISECLTGRNRLALSGPKRKA
jgi:Lon protease-like protein